MKKAVIALVMMTVMVMANPLGIQNNAGAFKAEIDYFYHNAGESSYSFVVVKNVSNPGNTGSVTHGKSTSDHSYLAYENSDKAMIAQLINAKNTNQKVIFRLSDAKLGSANKISYIRTNQ